MRRAHAAGQAQNRPLAGLFFLLAAVLLANTLVGPLVGGVLEYPVTGTLLNQLLGLELVTVLVVVPMAVGAAVLLWFGHPAAPYLGFGAGAYTGYMFLQYVLGPSYTSYQPAVFVHLAIFSLGCAVGAWSWALAARQPVPAPTPRRRRCYGVLLLGLAGFVVVRYVPALVGAASSTRLPPEFAQAPGFYWSIVLLDLGLVVPATVVAAVALLRGARNATTALYATVIWYALVPASVAAMSIAMLANGDPNAAAAQTWLLSTVAVLFAGFALWVYLPLFRMHSTRLSSGSDVMKRLRERHPVSHALVWIAIYIAAVFVGDGLTEALGLPGSSITALVLVGLVALIFGYLRRNRWLGYYGFRRIQTGDARSALWYSPLAVIVVLMYVRGIDPSLTVTRVVVLLVLFCCVGFLEEVLFRGLLYKALAEKGTVARAVVVSGVTFGLGHAVNLARGSSATEQTIQIIYGISLGIVLALLIAVTANIVPLVLFHVFLNISGNLTQPNALVEVQLTVAMVLICVGYTWWLVRELHRRSEADVIVPAT